MPRGKGHDPRKPKKIVHPALDDDFLVYIIHMDMDAQISMPE